MKSGISVNERNEAAQHEGASDEEHTGERDFGEDEGAAASFGAGAAAGARGAFERVLQIWAGGGEGWAKTEYDSGQSRDDENKGERPDVDVSVDELRKAVRCESFQRIEPPGREADTE